MSLIFTSKNIFSHNYLDDKCQDINMTSKLYHYIAVCPLFFYNMWLHVLPLCQIWWEQAASMMVWSTVMGRASNPAVNTSVCVWTGPSAVWRCALSPSLPVCGAKRHGGSKSGDNAVSNGSVMSPREGAKRPHGTQWRVGHRGYILGGSR